MTPVVVNKPLKSSENDSAEKNISTKPIDDEANKLYGTGHDIITTTLKYSHQMTISLK